MKLMTKKVSEFKGGLDRAPDPTPPPGELPPRNLVYNNVSYMP